MNKVITQRTQQTQVPYSLIRAAIVGVGGWGKYMGSKIAKCAKINLIASFDSNTQANEEFCKTYKCKQAKSFQELLTDKNIEAVFIFTPNFFHKEQVILAAQYGKHIYVTKPIANHIEEAQEMLTACSKAGVVLFVGHNRRREAGIRKIKSMIEKKDLGKIVMIEANFSHSGGFSLTSSNWRWYNDKCPGGPLIQLAVHHIDTLNYLFGPIESVSANFTRVATKTEIPTVTTMLIEFESGLLGFLGSNYVSVYRYFINIYGTKANLYYGEFSPGNKKKFYLRKEDIEHREKEIPLNYIDVDLEAFSEFADCIREDKIPEVGPKEALKVLAFTEAAIESSKERKFVYLKKWN